MTAFNIIFVLLLLSWKIAAGYILHHAGFMTYEGEYYGSQAKISAWGVPYMNPNSRYEVSITLLNLDGDHVRLIKAGFHHAGYRTYEGEYYGATAKISAWGIPNMNPNSRFEVSITLINLEGTRVRLIKAGLHVFPKLYNNSDLRFFISANDDASRHYACYNMNNCRPSFILANSSVLSPGQAVAPLSQYDGEDRFITLSIRKDVDTLRWTVYREDAGTSSIIGWWRKGFLGDLDNKAVNVQWMAFVAYEDNDTGPTMGSGHYPDDGKNKAAYMMDLKFFDKTGTDYDPKIFTLIREDDKPHCYRSLPDANLGVIEVDDHKFYYGGPPGCKN